MVKSQENKTKLGNDYIVEEKVVLIEQKFREESRQSIHYEFYRQGCILVLLLMFLITKHFVANSWVSTFSTFIREDKAVLRDMEILMKKHVLMTTIQRTVAKSGFNSCGNSTTGLSDLTAFIKS